MYIAFKWLISLALAMWLAMCFTDYIINQSKRNIKEGISNPLVLIPYHNISRTVPKNLPIKSKMQFANAKPQTTEALHILMFLAGALAVSVFNKKKELLTFAKQKIKIDLNHFHKLQKKFEHTAVTLGVAIIKHCASLWQETKITYQTFKDILEQTRSLKKNKVINNLVDQLKRLREERNELNQLLIGAVHENKNIRMRFQLEEMSKNRLLRHIEDIQKQIKEHRSRYASFQQLYLITHQENIFLKSRIRKLTEQKDDAEKNLMRLINEIYKSANKELKSYCNRINKNAKEDKINSEVSAVVAKFLEKSRKSLGRYASTKGMDTSSKAWSSYIDDIVQDNSLVATKSDTPKLKGLPGEYVWTVKDKNGIIEKLYEYDSESDYDNGETIRRIRQYSVYFDKDCFLDYTISLPDSECKPSTSGYHINTKNPVAPKRIVTGSEAFQNFLRNNKSIVPSKKTRMILQN